MLYLKLNWSVELTNHTFLNSLQHCQVKSQEKSTRMSCNISVNNINTSLLLSTVVFFNPYLGFNDLYVQICKALPSNL